MYAQTSLAADTVRQTETPRVSIFTAGSAAAPAVPQADEALSVDERAAALTDAVDFSARARSMSRTAATDVSLRQTGFSLTGGASPMLSMAEDSEARPRLQALAASVSRISGEIGQVSQNQMLLPHDREGRLSQLRSELSQAQEQYFKAQCQARGGIVRGGSKVM